MANVFGPKLGLLFNANLNEFYGDNFRKFLQALDQLIMGNVINSTTVVPPVSPNPGDAYLISSTASGAWTTFPVNSIAVWDTQVTNSGTNTQVPAWVNYVPNAGWIVWNVATAAALVYSGSSWGSLGGGANFPVNTNITSMTALNTTASNAVTISSASVNSNNAIIVTDGTHTSSWASNGVLTVGQVSSSGNISGAIVLASGGLVSNNIGNATPGTPITVNQTGGSTSTLVLNSTSGVVSTFGNTWIYGDLYNNNTSGIQVANQTWTGAGYTGLGIGVINTTGSGATGQCVIGAGTISMSGVLVCGSVTCTSGVSSIYTLRVGSTGVGTINSYTAGQPLQVGALGNPTGVSLYINSGQSALTKGQGYLGFNGNYWTQTTVGAAGGASAPPSTPALWLPVNVNGTNYLMPLYTYA